MSIGSGDTAKGELLKLQFQQNAKISELAFNAHSAKSTGWIKKKIVQNDTISVNLQIIAQTGQLSHMFRDTGLDSYANTVGKTVQRD